MKSGIITTVLVTILCLVLFIPTITNAVDIKTPSPETNSNSIWPSSWGSRDKEDVTGTVEAKTLINPILIWVINIVGIICVIMIVYAGIKITTSGEKDDQRKKGIQTLTWALVGLIITLVSYSIVAIVGGGILKEFGGK